MIQLLHSIIASIYRKTIKKIFYKKPHKTIISIYQAPDFIPSTKCVLISHFDPIGVFDDVFIYYVTALKKLNFDIYIITTCIELDKNSLKSTLKLANVIIHRENIGLDFASWAAAIKKYNILKKYDSVLLTNDSIKGPLFNLNTYLDFFENSDGLGGFTESSIIKPHLQSYFLYINQKLVKKRYLQKFFNKILILKDKKDIILFYEIGLSQIVLSNGDKLTPYISIKNSYSLVDPKYRNETFRPTTHAWYPIIKRYRFPFIKRVVLTDASKLNIYFNSLEKIDVINSKPFKDNIIKYTRRFRKNNESLHISTYLQPRKIH